MQQAASSNNPPTTAAPKVESSRNFWIYTGYAAAALGLLGLVAYHFSGYLLK